MDGLREAREMHKGQSFLKTIKLYKFVKFIQVYISLLKKKDNATNNILFLFHVAKAS